MRSIGLYTCVSTWTCNPDACVETLFTTSLSYNHDLAIKHWHIAMLSVSLTIQITLDLFDFFRLPRRTFRLVIICIYGLQWPDSWIFQNWRVLQPRVSFHKRVDLLQCRSRAMAPSTLTFNTTFAPMLTFFIQTGLGWCVRQWRSNQVPPLAWSTRTDD